MGWTGAATVAGVAWAVAGWVLLKATSGAHQLCHVFASLDDLAAGSAGPQPLPRPSCSTTDDRYFLALGILWAGVALAVVGIVAMARRARASRRAGCPWLMHRVTTRVAVWIDPWLPGQRRADGNPRISNGLVSVMGVMMLLVAINIGVAGWGHFARIRDARSHHRGQVALAALKLPVGVMAGSADGSKSACAPSPDTLCASSPLPPAQVDAMLRRLIHGKPNPAICALLPSPAGPPTCAIYGKLGGYGAMAIAFNHLVVVRSGAPPPGAVPVHPGNKRFFYLGTDVTITLLTPTA